MREKFHFCSEKEMKKCSRKASMLFLTANIGISTVVLGDSDIQKRYFYSANNVYLPTNKFEKAIFRLSSEGNRWVSEIRDSPKCGNKSLRKWNLKISARM